MQVFTRYYKWLGFVILLGSYWFLPISGQMILLWGDKASWPNPQFILQPNSPEQVSIWVTDNTAWSHVRLMVNHQPTHFESWQTNHDGSWSWHWTTAKSDSYQLAFYYDCDTGCQLRGQMAFGVTNSPPLPNLRPTKLGVVFANPNRNWHGRSGWAVDLTYAHDSENTYWNIDRLAQRVQQQVAIGSRVLVRVDYAPNQSLPPADNQVAFDEYLLYLQRLTRDDRLRGVYGYIIGSDYNTLGQNQLDPRHPVTPEWVARLLVGYGEAITNSHNLLETVRAINPQTRVLVGPVQPWNEEQNGDKIYRINMAWLNYFNTLVALLDETAQAKANAGKLFISLDGFAVQTAGQVNLPELKRLDRALEPTLDLPRGRWHGAQAGFQVYRDWLNIINQYETTRQVPVYISSVNTFIRDQNITPAQNYPSGWLTNALNVIQSEPQVVALCWFMDDIPNDEQWREFSLTHQFNHLGSTATEFDQLLQQP